MINELPFVSIIVIGHNEEKNLTRCFEAIKSMDYPSNLTETIFADSDSTDNSIGIASLYTNNIISNVHIWSSAGFARNEGLMCAKYDYVHFIDGDIEIDSQYLRKAISFLEGNKSVCAVTGYYIEMSTSFWNKIMDYRRDDGSMKSEGFTNNTSGGGTYRKEVLYEVDGYDERIRKGQESELGARLQGAGHKIWFLNVCQGKHNFDINSTLDMIKRSFSNGVSSGHLLILSVIENGNQYVKIYRKGTLKTIIIYSLLFAVFIALFINSKVIGAFSLILLFYLYLIVSLLFRKREQTLHYKIHKLANSLFQGIAYFGIMYFLIKYLFLRARGIEIIMPKMRISQE